MIENDEEFRIIPPPAILSTVANGNVAAQLACAQRLLLRVRTAHGCQARRSGTPVLGSVSRPAKSSTSHVPTR